MFCLCFFDLEKAYDTTWRYGILKDLHDLGLKGRLPLFIQSFLEDRTMQVRVGSTLSDLYYQEQGVPQGSILSTTLFNIKINNIVNCLDTKTDGSLYVGGGRVVQWCWANFQCRGVLLIWIRVGQGPSVLAVGAGGGCLDIFSLVYHFSFFLPLSGRRPNMD